MNLKQEVQLYLQLCCTPNMSANCIRKVNHGEISWFVKVFHWDLLCNYFQTITWKKDALILELWDTGCDDGVPVHREEYPSEIDLEDLHINLQAVAKEQSRNLLNRYLLSDWKATIDKLLASISKGIETRDAAIRRYKTTEQIKEKLAKVEFFARGGELSELTNISLQELEADINDQIAYLHGLVKN